MTYYYRRPNLWFRDVEGNFVWQVAIHLPETKYTRAIDFGFGADPARAWFMTYSSLNPGNIVWHFHSYFPSLFGGMNLGFLPRANYYPHNDEGAMS
jgi:hypothetical protein